MTTTTAGERDTSSVTNVDPALAYVRTRFLERVAHDLRGPSGVALGALDEISAALSSGDVDRVALLLRIAQRAQAKVLRIADKLTRTAMMSQGVPLDLGPVEIGPMIERTTKAAESVEGRRNVRTSVELAPDLGVVRADAGWLEMLLTELTADAITHARSDVRVSAKRSGKELVVQIHGDGRSAPPSPRPLLAPSDERRGLGVSMSLASMVMAALGGSIETGEVDGKPGVRLRFVDPARAA